jgi:DNA-binding transcriptional LysR family regulator
MLPGFHCLEDLRKKKLERVLPDRSAPETPVHAVFPSNRLVATKVRAFVEHVRASWDRLTHASI